MKTLFLTGSLNQGDVQYHLLQLAKLFKDNNRDIEIFALSDYNFYKPFVLGYKNSCGHLLNEQSKLKRVILAVKIITNKKLDLIILYLKAHSQVALFTKILSRVKARPVIGGVPTKIIAKKTE